ncbi:bifunctional homocysteine S-methyltransferase/methylenetetrahydrofolate reductase [Fluviispira sanaruensis]|uniref:Bifunctional homocysteine S-methyltransferase/methylenetetrahydrofolate reductase n=1 Tax=Fluviispira sanaruensis TaxID=2493639 RepID=A0A4P2VTF3_FLUSA|nr:bifunctional homocysteine S-methyltransferase/methylenetetrahydrofolate reductase [Fluviispira sanaruensis]BBH52655.1 bifunctional homocysteine S-methyltransferase/methylenetetrahydrofolate reductase [Fluviispira sanaruensis]
MTDHRNKTPQRCCRSFRKSLSDGDCVLLGGSTGSLLYEKGIFINRSFDEVNLSQPDLVSKIHSDFIAAGAQIIGTNTWGANSFKLKAFGLENKFREINFAGAELARKAALNQTWVAGTLGPLGVRIEPWGPTSLDEARDVFKAQAEALIKGGVDLFIMESFADLYEIQQAIRAVRELGDLPIIAMMSVNEEGHSLYGTEPEWYIRKLDEWGADVVGADGGNGPTPMLELLKKFKSSTKKPIILCPNAGQPRMVDGRLIYMASPEYMGEFARQAFLKGARLLGGSSGTSPAHIKIMAGALRQAKAFDQVEIKPHEIIEHTLVHPTTVPRVQQSNWAKKIADGEFVVCMELLPPKGLETEKIIERSEICKKHGIDAINIPDGPRASARMSSLATACIIEREVGIESILHYACRDRNLLGIQSDLLGASGLGIKNILCITGDPPKMGPYPNATAVFDIDAIGLVNMVTRLNTGYDLGGSSIGRHTSMSVGVGANPVAIDLEKEKSRFRYKVEAGAEWAITQPVFDSESLFRFLEFSSQFRIPIIAGIWPLKSIRNAEFMANEVPGVFIPNNVLERMRKCKTAEEQTQEGILIARELIEEIKSSVQGLQISAPLGMVDFALKLL